jgi:hypothetical protein
MVGYIDDNSSYIFVFKKDCIDFEGLRTVKVGGQYEDFVCIGKVRDNNLLFIADNIKQITKECCSPLEYRVTNFNILNRKSCCLETYKKCMDNYYKENSYIKCENPFTCYIPNISNENLCPRCEGGFGSSWNNSDICPKCGYPGFKNKE